MWYIQKLWSSREYASGQEKSPWKQDISAKNKEENNVHLALDNTRVCQNAKPQKFGRNADGKYTITVLLISGICNSVAKFERMEIVSFRKGWIRSRSTPIFQGLWFLSYVLVQNWFHFQGQLWRFRGVIGIDNSFSSQSKLSKGSCPRWICENNLREKRVDLTRQQKENSVSLTI